MRDEPNLGCYRTLAPGQWWNYCGETDMGQTAPVRCRQCDPVNGLRLPTEPPKLPAGWFRPVGPRAYQVADLRDRALTDAEWRFLADLLNFAYGEPATTSTVVSPPGALIEVRTRPIPPPVQAAINKALNTE